MNPALLIQAVPLVLDLLNGGKLDSVLDSLPFGAAGVKNVLGSTEATPESVVMGALSLLNTYAPKDPTRAAQYQDALVKILAGLSALKGSLSP